MESDPQRRREDPAPRAAGAPEWSPYDAMADAEEVAWRRSRRRRMLFGGGIFLLVLCVVGSVVGYIWYDRATKVDRSTPIAVVVQYVDAIFEYRDPARAKLFECDGSNPGGALREQLRLVEDRERTFDVIFIVTVPDFTTEELGHAARVKADIEYAAPMEGGFHAHVNHGCLS